MVKKRHVAGRRVLSIFLCLMMMLCTVPMVAFAAIEPIIPDKDVTYPVVDRSAANVMLYKSIKPIADQAQIEAGSRLGDFTFVKTGLRVCIMRENGTTEKNYSTTMLTVEFERKDETAKPGLNTEIVKIFVTKDPSIWIKIEYAFEAVSTGVPQAVIETLPTFEPIKYKEGIKTSDLTMNTQGAKATVNGEPLDGEFRFTEPNKALVRGNNQISVTFFPADPLAASSATGIATATVDVGHPEIISSPVITVEYGKLLKDVKLMDLDGWVTTPATGVKVDWLDMSGKGLADERAGQVLPIGEYDDIKVRLIPDSFTNYEGNYDTVKVKVIQVTGAFPMDVSADAASRSIIVKGKGPSGAQGTVAYTLRGDGVEQTAANKAVDEQVVFNLGATAGNGDYTVTAVYTGSGAQDPCAYASAEKTVNATFPNTVTVTGGSGSGDYQAGDRVTVWLDLESIEKNYQFKSWKITNANGETIDVGVADLTANDISFTMPDEAVNVEAVTSFSIQLFFENIGNAIMEFLMKIVEFFMGIFGGLG